MDKLRLLSLVVICVIVSVIVEISAKPVSEAQARNVAAQFMRSRGMGMIAVTPPAKVMRSIGNITAADITAVYNVLLEK